MTVEPAPYRIAIHTQRRSTIHRGDRRFVRRVEVHNLGAARSDVRAILFESFQRQRRPSQGLYIARQIAKAHGGDVTVASSDTDGTRFTVRLPRP